MNKIVLTLMEAVITLYQADPTGAPITSNPIWAGVDADNLQISDKWVKVETRPTGAAFPIKHPLVPQYEINIARVWALQLSDLVGFQPVRGNYVLDIVWTDQDSGDWHREIFYGVTISDRNRGSRDVDGGYVENQVFDAQDMVPTSGQGSPPAINADLAYTVKYIDIDGHSQLIYTYDSEAKAFTPVGDPSSMATLVSDNISFRVTFAGSQMPELQVPPTGVVVTQLRTGAPTSNNAPRVDFFYGGSRLASITRFGEFYGQSFFEGVIDPQNRQGVFQLFSGGSLVGTVELARVTAASYSAFTPDDIPGLKLWCDVESFSAVPAGTPIAVWKDRSTNGNDLVQPLPANQPSLSRAAIDPVSGQVIARDGLPSVFFNPDLARFLQTAGNAFATRQFTIFLLAWQQDDAEHFMISTAGNLNYDFLSFSQQGERHNGSQTFNFQFPGANYMGFDGVDNTHIGGFAMNPYQWNIVEFELTAGKVFSTTVNGSVNWSFALAGNVSSTPGEDDRPIVIGDAGARESMNGYVRALLVYDTPPTAAQKDQIRKYLTALYNRANTVIGPIPISGRGQIQP